MLFEFLVGFCPAVQPDAQPGVQAEKLRSKAQRPETTRSTPQLCRYLLYLGRIRAIQLEYTDAKDCLQQAARKARSPSVFPLSLVFSPAFLSRSARN